MSEHKRNSERFTDAGGDDSQPEQRIIQLAIEEVLARVYATFSGFSLFLIEHPDVRDLLIDTYDDEIHARALQIEREEAEAAYDQSSDDRLADGYQRAAQSRMTGGV